ncbi:MAG: hypothetical protein JNN04_10200 [Cyclobacteriaceae bacterium]|nr:hypothetical protein [Cyclobacteriaceae bacterium]
MRNLVLVAVGLFSSCTDSAVPVGDPLPELTGSWKYVSRVVSDCDDPGGDFQDVCTGSAGDCGVLTIKESSWTWVQNLPDGSQFTESGTYVLSSNYIILTEDTVPGLGKYSITGSTVSYTTTSLTFVNSSETSGCVYTVTFSRHLQSSVPAGK